MTAPTSRAAAGTAVAPGYDLTSGRTLWQHLEHWSTARADQEALVFLRDVAQPTTLGSITWECLAETVDVLRRRLVTAGAADQAAVLLALPNSPLLVALWLAVPANGAIAQVTDPDTGILAFERTLVATRPVLAVASTATATVLAEAIRRAGTDTELVIAAEEDLWEPARALADHRPGRIPLHGPTPEMVAGRLPTSGTSGRQKLVELTHRNYVMSAERMARNSGYTSADRHYLCSPFFHTNAQLYLCAPPIVTGGSISIVPRFSATHYFSAARWTGATVSSMVAPPMRMALHKALEAGRPVDSGELRLVQYGMNLSPSDWRAWDELVPGVQTRQIYGQTESVTGVLGTAVWEDDDRATIGRPFLGVEDVRLVADDGSDVADGQPGELWVRGVPGNTLMLGYHDAPEDTARTVVDGRWLRTGDVMVRHPDGRFEFRGRAMHIIRRGGENLSTYGLELDLQTCPLVDDVAVTAQEDPTLDAVVVAHVIPGAAWSEEGFLAWCREHLGKRGVPDSVRVHAQFPRTGSGRVIARELK
jgi:crotonobetaine/carnitine-CoA ligase